MTSKDNIKLRLRTRIDSWGRLFGNDSSRTLDNVCHKMHHMWLLLIYPLPTLEYKLPRSRDFSLFATVLSTP